MGIKFKIIVEFVIQLAPNTEADRKDVEKIVAGWKNDDRVDFITHKLLKDAWYNAIQAVDVVYLPYTAERYLYNWSAIYFTAIGAKKPVLTTRTLNPEVMDKFYIGEYIDTTDPAVFHKQLEDFVNNYQDNKAGYARELKRANREYGKSAFIHNLLQ